MSMDKGAFAEPPPPPPSYNTYGYIAPIKGDIPVPCRCQFCQQSIVTRTEKKSGLLTWGSCVAISILGAPFGCFLGCCLIPFCIDPLKDTMHRCPNCSQIVGHGTVFD